jgi:hypothetical protein
MYAAESAKGCLRIIAKSDYMYIQTLPGADISGLKI